MEHAHHMDGDIPVRIRLTMESSALHIEVEDQGKGFAKMPPPPDLRAMIEEGTSTRGWGLFLIRHLTDELTFEHTPEGGHVVHMILRLPSGPESS
jgi:anti-sigma regulatory factor (Ser/Thr protein kinase)